MKTREFSFNLPQSFIAQYPKGKRADSRLLVVDRAAQTFTHHKFKELPGLLAPDTVMVVNNTKVRKARVFAKSKDTGGMVEFLLLKETARGMWQVLCSKSKKQKQGKVFIFPEKRQAVIVQELGELRVLKFDRAIDEKYLNKHGHVPLPPYIKRQDEVLDKQRYQTVYSKISGSIAAPTAGLHFSKRTIRLIAKRGIELAQLSLHVGLGTFTPIRTENIEDHAMHSEEYMIPSDTALCLNKARFEQRNILAVGTTSVRALESAYSKDGIKAGKAVTNLFIYPGFKFNVVSQLLTNFHTPGSSLLLLVSAFAGKELILSAYEEAKKQNYRFFSYGDAMLIL
ncbi:MAG: tRNA preQ1(34) S-adenosylmethionine ribosyltransferase-isomerase QueA [Spirochaetales bacterium]|nr:tRNA preQ1(34) S-adenosylmethionine ribosyltransferase-isomerase QueA [Spirochaetales bacterium]